MKKIIKSFIASTVLLSVLLVPAGVGAQFDTLEQVCGPDSTSAVCTENERGKDEDPFIGENSTLEIVANFLAVITGVIAVIIIIIAGITMMLSGGDSTKVQNSRNAIIYAAIGIVVVTLARTIVVFVVNRV